MPAGAGLTLLSADGVVTTAQQVVIGVALGFCLQLMFDALTLGGQLIANSMGLAFAFNLDPLRGVEHAGARAVLRACSSRWCSSRSTATCADRDAGRRAFAACRSGRAGFGPRGAAVAGDLGQQLFGGALRVALPGITALLVVNLAFGVVSRAAPALNLFAVGFPVTLVFGLVVVLARAAAAADRFDRPAELGVPVPAVR